MGRIEELASVYQRHVSAPWQRTVAGAQRVMIVVYEKELERTLRARLGEFEQATRDTGHGWRVVDCTRWFALWMTAGDYREAYFEDPSLLVASKLEGQLRQEVAQRLSKELEEADEDSVVALVGVGSLYGFLRVSNLITDVEPSIRGRLVVFFPGTKNENVYRLLDARDGPNYLANGITLNGEGPMP